MTKLYNKVDEHQGYWVDTKTGFTCPKCKKELIRVTPSGTHGPDDYASFYTCEHCGAELDKVE